MKHSRKERKRLIFISFAIVCAVSVLFLSVYSDWKQIMNNNNQISVLTDKYNNLLDEEKSLESEVVKLKDPAYIARYAKEKFLYSSAGETILRMDE